MSYTKEMFNSIKRKDSVELKKQFDSAVRSKIAGQFDVKKKEIAQSMFEDVTNEATDFKPGMRVKVKDTVSDKVGKKYAGKKGTVIRLDGNWIIVKIDRARSGEVEFSKGELEKIGVSEESEEDSDEHLDEAKTSVEVSVRDAKKANDIASDMFRGEYKNDGSNVFVFKNNDAADDFKSELKKQKIELSEESLDEGKSSVHKG